MRFVIGNVSCEITVASHAGVTATRWGRNPQLPWHLTLSCPPASRVCPHGDRNRNTCPEQCSRREELVSPTSEAFTRCLFSSGFHPHRLRDGDLSQVICLGSDPGQGEARAGQKEAVARAQRATLLGTRGEGPSQLSKLRARGGRAGRPPLRVSLADYPNGL